MSFEQHNSAQSPEEPKKTSGRAQETAADFQKRLVDLTRGANPNIGPVRILDAVKTSKKQSPTLVEVKPINLQLAPMPLVKLASKSIPSTVPQKIKAAPPKVQKEKKKHPHDGITRGKQQTEKPSETRLQYFSALYGLPVSTPQQTIKSLGYLLKNIVTEEIKPYEQMSPAQFRLFTMGAFSEMYWLLNNYPLDTKPPVEEYLRTGLRRTLPEKAEKVRSVQKKPTSSSPISSEKDYPASSAEAPQPPQE